MKNVTTALGLSVLLIVSCPAGAGPRLDGTGKFARANGLAAAGRTITLARRGNSRAQSLLGLMYEYGNGVPQSDAEAAYWYRRAADQSHPTAQYLLGLMYEKGHGVSQSDMQAYVWLSLAAANAPRPAKEYYSRVRNAVAAKLSRAEIIEAQAWAAQFSSASR